MGKSGSDRNYKLLLSISVSILVTGCPLDLGETNRPIDDLDPIPQQFVTIQFANLSFTEAVNVDFYATNNPLMNVPEELFLPINRIIANVGVAGTGVLEARTVDEIEFRCTANMTLGTTGGRFVDNQSGEERGLGTPRWLQEGPLALCGGTVIFAYRSEVTGFDTTVSIGN